MTISENTRIVMYRPNGPWAVVETLHPFIDRYGNQEMQAVVRLEKKLMGIFTIRKTITKDNVYGTAGVVPEIKVVE